MWTPPGAADNRLRSSPKDTEVLELLELVQVVAECTGSGLISPPGILPAVGLLVGAIRKEPRPLLDSEVYRRLLWDSLDAVIWQELLERLYRMVLGKADCPDRGSLRTLVAGFWLVAEVGHVALGVDRGLKVHERLRLALRHENTLYQHRSRYRDHLFHAVRTFAMGLSLLTAGNGPFAGCLRGKSNAKKQRLLRNWFVAGLCHDFGYVMELCPDVLRHMEKYAHGRLSNAVEVMQTTWNMQIKGLNQELEKDGRLAAGLDSRCDHGIASYFHLQKLLEETRGRCSAADYEPAGRAILAHNLPSEPVDVKTDPIAGALIICDEIQEWDRPLHDADCLAESVASLINLERAAAVPGRRIAEPMEVLNCSMVGGRLKVASGESAKIVIRYTDQNENVFDPLGVILRKIYNLERITNLNSVNLSVELWVKALVNKFDTPSEPRVREMDILRDFVLLREVSYYSPALYTPVEEALVERARCAYVPHATVRRETDEGPNLWHDRLVLNFAKFPPEPRKNRLVRTDPSEFFDELREFKREYCRKKGVECRCYADDEPWEIKQIW
jgi:hypothetical protein